MGKKPVRVGRGEPGRRRGRASRTGDGRTKSHHLLKNSEKGGGRALGRDDHVLKVFAWGPTKELY